MNTAARIARLEQRLTPVAPDLDPIVRQIAGDLAARSMRCGPG
jgi:hypothetical protein